MSKAGDCGLDAGSERVRVARYVYITIEKWRQGAGVGTEKGDYVDAMKDSC